MSGVTRTFSLRPYVCFDKGTGVGLDLHSVLEEVRLNAELCASEALKHVTVENLGKLSEHDRLKPAVAGLRMGMRFSVTGRSTGRSRFERMVQEYAVLQLRSWRERQRACMRQSDKYVSIGYKHTVRMSKPASLKPRLALSVTDRQYQAVRLAGSSVELDMVVNGRWVTFRFKAPSRFLEESVRIIAPTVTVDEKDRVVFNWYVELPVERAEFSSRYVIGVDVGITNHTTAVVRDITTGQIVEASFMNRRVRSLENKIKRTKTQIAALYRKGRVGEVEVHRRALSNRRKELAVLIGQEIADMSWKYGNALVAVEDLSHMVNTMKYGRWVRGLIIKRITDMVESNGGRVMTVNPSYTSRKCHQCDTMLDMTDYYHPVCVTCRVSWDRDENAAANIAEKLKDKERHKKACQTRKKHASKKRHRNSKGSLHQLKYPLKKTNPTPKAPQNQPKNRNNHTTHHTQRVIHNREGVFPALCAAGWSLHHSNASVPAVASTPEGRCSDNKPHDYSTHRATLTGSVHTKE